MIVEFSSSFISVTVRFCAKLPSKLIHCGTLCIICKKKFKDSRCDPWHRSYLNYCKVAGSNCKVAGSNLTCRDDRISGWRLHSVGPTSTGLSLLGQNIIHLPVVRVVCGWWALAYKLTRMLGSTKNVPHHAIWRLRGSLNENASFSSLSHTSRLIWLYRHSVQ